MTITDNFQIPDRTLTCKLWQCAKSRKLVNLLIVKLQTSKFGIRLTTLTSPMLQALQ